MRLPVAAMPILSSTRLVAVLSEIDDHEPDGVAQRKAWRRR